MDSDNAVRAANNLDRYLLRRRVIGHAWSIDLCQPNSTARIAVQCSAWDKPLRPFTDTHE